MFTEAISSKNKKKLVSADLKSCDAIITGPPMPLSVRFLNKVLIVAKDPETISTMSAQLFEMLSKRPTPSVFSYSSTDERLAFMRAGEVASLGSSDSGVM